MISVLHNIMWSIEQNVTHKAKGKNSTSIWTLVGQDGDPCVILILCVFVGFTTGHFMFESSFALCPRAFQSF